MSRKRKSDPITSPKPKITRAQHRTKAPSSPKRRDKTPPPDPERVQRKAADEARITERRAKVFEMVKAGFSYRDVSRELGISVSLAWEDVQAELFALRAVTTDLARQYRDMDLERLARITASLYPRAIMRRVEDPDHPGQMMVQEADIRVVHTLLAVMDRRSKYLGNDAPDTTVELQIPYDKLTDDQLSRIAAGEDIPSVLREVVQSPTSAHETQKRTSLLPSTPPTDEKPN